MSRPLDGVTVLDLGQIYNGPYCGWILAMLGARVIKIEPPTGDVVRGRMRGARDPYPYLMLNTNKDSVVLDLKHADGQRLFLDLVDHADVVVENFAVGVMDRLGIGWDVLHARNSRLVLASGKGYGLSGPYRDFPAMDLTIQAVSGALNATGYPELPPVKAGPAISDFLGGVHLLAGVLAALFHRQRTGEGQLVEGSMHEAAVAACASALGAFMDGDARDVPPRTGNRHPALAIAPYNVYEAEDGYVAVICVAPRHWERLVKVMGRDDLLGDPRVATAVDRAEHVDVVDGVVGGWIAGRRKLDVMEILNAEQIPCASVQTMKEVAEDPHLLARGAFVDVPHPVQGTVRLPLPSFRLHGADPMAIEKMAPALAQETAAVLQEFLGLDEDEIAMLAAKGAIGLPSER